MINIADGGDGFILTVQQAHIGALRPIDEKQGEQQKQQIDAAPDKHGCTAACKNTLKGINDIQRVLIIADFSAEIALPVLL